jgi:hypothetical protein
MKTLFIATSLFLLLGLTSLTYANDSNPIESFYIDEVEQKITFYQNRMYLKLSENKILSDLAVEAETMISFLEVEKTHLVAEMVNNEFNKSQSKRFVTKMARHNINLE